MKSDQSLYKRPCTDNPRENPSNNVGILKIILEKQINEKINQWWMCNAQLLFNGIITIPLYKNGYIVIFKEGLEPHFFGRIRYVYIIELSKPIKK